MLSLVEPSKDISAAYYKKSVSNLDSARILLSNNKLEEPVSLIYYSMYNMSLALLFREGIKCENHSATIILLDLIFGINNTDILHAKTERIDKQYYVDFSLTKKEVETLLSKAEKFNIKIYELISRMSNKEIINYRKKLNEILAQLTV